LVREVAKAFFSAKTKPNPMNIRTLDRKITELQLDGYVLYAASSKMQISTT